MYDYMRVLHQRFCKEPERKEVQEDLEQAYHILREKISWQDRETLLRIVDLEIELQEETSLTSFIAGFQLGMGIARELEPYSFEDEEERQATERAKMRYSQVKN